MLQAISANCMLIPAAKKYKFHIYHVKSKKKCPNGQ